MSTVKDEGRVLTVTGPISPDDMGVCLAHEHVLWDMRDVYWVDPTDPELIALAQEPVSLDTRNLLMSNAVGIKENLYQDSVALAVDEVSHFKACGGSTIVEASCIGLGRNPLGLKEVSEATGLNIVAATGYYIAASHPGWVATKSIAELAEVLIRDVEEGIDGTQVRAGVMSDVGTTGSIAANEEKTLRACARAQRATGAGLGIHIDPTDSQGMRVLEILFDEGVRPERIVLQHMDERPDTDYHLEIAATGVFLEFDTWGQEAYIGAPVFWQDPTDGERAHHVKALVDRGYLGQLLLSHDVCYKHLLKQWGGDGYEGLFKRGIPQLLSAGVTDAEVQTMLVDNPRRFFPLAV